jgi:hypothetical protein
MHSFPGRDEKDEVMRSLRGRMVANALHHLTNIDLRTATVLQELDLIDPVEPEVVSPKVLDSLRQAAQNLQTLSPIGPVLFVQISEGRRSAVTPAEHLEHPDRTVREAAVEYFSSLTRESIAVLTPRTRTVLEQSLPAIVSDRFDVWWPAARSVVKSLNDDYLLNLAGLDQCFKAKFEEGVLLYFVRVMRPTTTALDKLKFDAWSHDGKSVPSDILIAGWIGESSTLTDACDRYLRGVGCVPLGPAHSLGALVREWGRLRGTDNAWTNIWAWAEQRPGPLPRYHACTVFVDDPSLIPQGSEAILWSEIAEIAHVPPSEKSDLRWTQAWRIRCELALHYLNHLECIFPGNPGENLAWLAWWLAENVAVVFGDSSGPLARIRATAVQPELRRSSLILQLTHPQSVPSTLRFATRYLESLWSRSIINFVGPRLGELNMPAMRPEDRARISEQLAQALLSTFPLKESDRPTYGFERSLPPIVDEWLNRETHGGTDETLRILLSGMNEATKISDPARLLQELLEQDDPTYQLLIARILRTMAYTGLIPRGELWKSLLKPDVCSRLLSTASEESLAVLFDALCETQAQEGEPLASQMPHAFASAAENCAIGDPKRLQVLVSMTVFASLISDNASAVERLSKNSGNPAILKEIAESRQQLTDMLPLGPAWFTARIRGLLPSLE